MISRPEYAANSKELDILAGQYAVKMQKEIADATTAQLALKIARKIQLEYHEEMRHLVVNALKEVGDNAVDHYARITGLPRTTVNVNAVLGEQLVEKYYGASLYSRLETSKRYGYRNLTRSAHVGINLPTRKANLVRFFLEAYPFGAQVTYDRRILLSEIVRIEHKIALKFAVEADIKLIRWTLSHRHVKKDVCDALSEHIDPNVVDYISEHKLKISPEGVYFIQNVPDPPHPNCQCSLQFIKGKVEITAHVTRPLSRIRNLLRRLFRR